MKSSGAAQGKRDAQMIEGGGAIEHDINRHPLPAQPGRNGRGQVLHILCYQHPHDVPRFLHSRSARYQRG